MAGAGYKLFNTGDVLTAAQVNTYLMQQTVMVFADSTARTTALSGVLAEGMLSYLQNTNAVEVYDGSSWVGVSGAGDITAVTAGTGISGGGTSGAVTITNSMATTIDAKGDLIIGTGSDAFGRLAVGTNNFVLTADSGETTGIKWAAASGMTSLATGSLSGGTVTISSIPSTYNDLRLVIRNFKPANDNQQIELRFNGDSNTRYSTVNNGDGTTTNQSFGNTSASLYGNNDNSVATGLIVVEIPDYANTATWKFLTSNALSVNSTTTTNWNWYPSSSFYNQTAAISSITLFPQTGDFTSGDYILYGVK